MTAIPDGADPIRVYRPGAYSTVATPAVRTDISYRPEKNGTGTGTFTIPMDDGAYGDIQINDVAAIREDGTTVASMIVEMIEERTLDADGGANETATYSGRLVGAFLEWALIYPMWGTGSKPIEEDSRFDWLSNRYDDSLDGWAAATEIMSVADAEDDGWPHQPMAADFDLTTGAQMILHSGGSDTYAPMGWTLLRLLINIDTAGRYGMESLMDDLGLAWIDSVQQLDVPSTDGFVRASFKWFDLSEGDHLFTWAVFNPESEVTPGDGWGPSALAFNLYKTDMQGHPLDGGLYRVSDSSVEVLYVGMDPWPGMTVGEILLDLLNEAVARGIASSSPCLDWLEPSFDSVNDSHGDPWDRDPGITTKTGTTTLLQLMDELVAQGRVSRWRINPDGVTFDVFRPDYETRPGDVELEPAPALDPNTGQVVELDRKIT